MRKIQTYIRPLGLALLASLILPALAQAQETKAAPEDPVFPYTLTIRQPAEGATLDVMTMNASGTYTAVSSGQTVYNTTKVDLFFAPRKGYQLTEGSITYNGNATTAETLAPNDKGYTAQRSFTMPAQPTTVTAEAELIRYTITYDPAGGTLPQGSPTQYTVVSDDLTLPTPTHVSAYVSFEGWKDTAGNTVTTVAKGSTGDLSLTAQWKESGLVEAVGRPEETRIVTTIMTADEIRADLAATWPKLTFTTDRGDVIESPISWKLKDGATLDLTPSKKNPFIWTAAPLPAGVKDNGYVMNGTTQVYLEASPITPEDNGEITITDENKFQQGGGTDNYFNGEINGEEGKTINKLTLTPPADTDMTIKLNEVTSATTLINGTGKTNLTLSGTNSLGAVTIEPGNELTLTPGENTGDLVNTAVTNNGHFTDLTARVPTVTLPGNITLERVDPAASTPIPSTDGYAELEASITAPEGTHMNLTYRWEIFNAQAGTWSTAPDDSQLRNASNTYRTRTVGQYRCLVTATVTGDGGTTTTTTLATPPVAVTSYVPPVTPPTPQPATYTVTLPALVGASTTPAAGAHTVTEGDGFSFTLTLDADYDQSIPVVTVNGNALTPDASGKYTIADISANQTVAITGIVRNTTTGIEQVENATLIRAESGALLIRTPVSVTAQVIALTGNVVHTVRLPAGDSRVDGLASGIYIVRLSNEITKKVIIR
ncbi:T9SS type A sorting domain-containing protein [Parabacteroides distasonis]|uniref:T9SS type A sorting domain-containing protein n=1 Tax=Parabacteroides distasonis TaxID=823 RepID=UPI0039B46547